MVATFRLKPQQRFSLSFGLSGSAMPDAKLFVPPPRLDLANRLPAETIFYTSYASNFGLSGRQLADALVSFFSSLDEDVPGSVRRAEKSTGVNRVKLLDAIGEQGVFALIAPTVVQPRGEDTFDQFAFLAVQEVASDGASGKVADALVDGFFKELEKISFADADPAVVTNVEGEPNTSAARIPGLLVEQVTAPVRFTQMISRLTALGASDFLEIGPGRVLSGLVARIERRSHRANLSGADDLEDAVKLATRVEAAGP